MASIMFITSICFLILLVPHSSSAVDGGGDGGDGDQKVTLSLYYESLCPFCANFIVNHLVNIFQNGLISIVNLRLIPWGNAFIQSDGSISCQHGPDECFLNTIEACSITIYPDVVRHFSFIYCIERLALEGRHADWIKCFEITKLGNLPIDCYTNGFGKQIEENYGKETSELKPAHRFVPWVVVNNQPLQEDMENYENYVCKAYKGKNIPQICMTLARNNYTKIFDGKAIAINQVCYAHQKVSPFNIIKLHY